jgi:zinc transporter
MQASPEQVVSGAQEALVAAYLLDGDGAGRAIGWDEIASWEPGQGLLWVHLDLNATAAGDWLRERSGLDPAIVTALLAEETRPRSLIMPGGLLAILRGVNTNPGADPEDMVSIRVWIEARRIISTRLRRLASIHDLREAIDRGLGPRTTGEFLVQLADRLVFRMREVIEQVEDTVSSLEEAVLNEEGQRLRVALARVRREAILLRRYLAPQRAALNRLVAERTPILDEPERLRLREVADAVTRYVEELDAARERSAVAQEELAARLAEQVNQRMYVLSIVAALFLPLGFLTGLLGINVGGIPGSEDPWAFFGVTGLMVLLIMVQLVIFRWRRWF